MLPTGSHLTGKQGVFYYRRVLDAAICGAGVRARLATEPKRACSTTPVPIRRGVGFAMGVVRSWFWVVDMTMLGLLAAPRLCSAKTFFAKSMPRVQPPWTASFRSGAR